jgi:hypothetical protein
MHAWRQHAYSYDYDSNSHPEAASNLPTEVLLPTDKSLLGVLSSLFKTFQKLDADVHPSH